MRVGCFLLVLAAAVFAQDAHDDAADAVLAAFAAEDGKALAALAAKDEPDPWLVADALCRRGKKDAALAFAKAAPRPAVAKLPAYVASGSDEVAAIRRAHEQAQGPRALVAVADAAERLGWLARAARALGAAVDAYVVAGEHGKALPIAERYLASQEAFDDSARVAKAHGMLGVVHLALGAYAKALTHLDRSNVLADAVGDRTQVAANLGNIGVIHEKLGDHARALRHLGRAAVLLEEVGDHAGAARMRGNIGTIHWWLGDHAEALAQHERALAISEKLGDRAAVAISLSTIGGIYDDLGRHESALAYQRRALAAEKDIGARDGTATALANIGNILGNLGRHEEALRYHAEAQALAREIGALETEVFSLGQQAKSLLASGNPKGSAAAARRAVEKLPLLVAGLADEQGARARDRWVRLTEVGVVAALNLRDAAQASYFLESGRAGTLLESLGARAKARDVLPAALRAEEKQARSAVAAARASLRAALAGRKRKEIAAARATLDAAHEALLAVIARIQRADKAVADLVYPEAATLAEIQATLRPGDAFVSCGMIRHLALAVIVTRDSARIVIVGEIHRGRRAGRREREHGAGGEARGLRDPVDDDHDLPWVNDPARPAAPALAKLRARIVKPLRLTDDTRRVLISPAGALSYVPFAALLPEREVVYVPSGTTYKTLLETRAERGAKVLALGDPTYTKLPRLPATRPEAEAIGDTVLLGADATRTRLHAALGQERWRAVHLACHGLVDPEQPLLSSLALTGGTLTAADVMRMKIPADLVVLSACETAKGKIYRAEGIVGFTRAFMLAGAPRVIVSLWKVDDEATRALMTEFYRAWREHPPATALRKAQAHVRSQGKWQHPYYWAAWQLWGLPE